MIMGEVVITLTDADVDTWWDGRMMRRTHDEMDTWWCWHKWWCWHMMMFVHDGQICSCSMWFRCNFFQLRSRWDVMLRCHLLMWRRTVLDTFLQQIFHWWPLRSDHHRCLESLAGFQWASTISSSFSFASFEFSSKKHKRFKEKWCQLFFCTEFLPLRWVDDSHQSLWNH